MGSLHAITIRVKKKICSQSARSTQKELSAYQEVIACAYLPYSEYEISGGLFALSWQITVVVTGHNATAMVDAVLRACGMSSPCRAALGLGPRQLGQC